MQQTVTDRRVSVLFHERNRGVGGATLTGMMAAVAAGADCLIKIDGDGQHDPSFIGEMAAPILAGEADYTKGNRFYRLEDLSGMPPVRIFGNAILSSWQNFPPAIRNVFDPTNGYIAIHSVVFHQLPEEKIKPGLLLRIRYALPSLHHTGEKSSKFPCTPYTEKKNRA